MRYVYILASLRHPLLTYVGSTSNLRRRLAKHNAGKSPYTAQHAPWRLVLAVWFRNGQRALELERYLKSGSGRAFALRHLL